MILKTVNTVVFDPNDEKGIKKLIADYEKYPNSLIGKNESGEEVTVSINSDNITTRTFQRNGGVRTNIYWKDGTKEELYDK